MTDHDNAYTALVEAQDDARWAFGTGFDDPLEGVDTSVPEGVDGALLAAYALMLADDALVAAQRLHEWTTLAPELEEEVALANVALDLLGQARFLLTRAAAADPAVVPALPPGSPVPPDDALAFFRDQGAFRNVRLVELENGDFACSLARLFLLSTWRLELLQRLTRSRDHVLAAVAAKGVKELTYHRDYSARWVVTLGQGTAESRRRLLAGLDTLWPYVEELFAPHPTELALAEVGVGVDPREVRDRFGDVVVTVLASAGVPAPRTSVAGGLSGRTGRHGVHTECLGRMLAEMQVVARAHPMGRW